MQKLKNSCISNNSRLNLNNKQINKRPADKTCENVVPAKKMNSNTSKPNKIILKCNEGFKLKTMEFVNNNLNQFDVNFTNSQIMCHSNSAENFTGSFYLKYYNNNYHNTHSNQLNLPNNQRFVPHRNPLVSAGSKKAYGNKYISNNLKEYGDIIEPLKETFSIINTNVNTLHPSSSQKIAYDKLMNAKINKINFENNHTSKNLNNKNSHSKGLKNKQNMINNKGLKLLNTNLECSNTLYPNVPPTTKMQQRMDDALEAIIYIITKAFNHEHNAIKDTHIKLYYQSFKTIIRERIEKVLMGHRVGSRSDIIDNYLKMYPKEMDTELISLFKSKNHVNNYMPYLIQSDDPKQYFSINMMRLINIKMKKLITVVEKLYENSQNQLDDFLKNAPVQQEPNHNEDTPEEVNYTIQKSIFYDKLMNYTIESEFTKLLKKFNNEIVHMILGKEISQAIELNLLQKTQRKNNNMEIDFI